MFIACGLNHKKTPLAIREQFAIPVADQQDFLQRLIDTPGIDEAAILSTCNRTEIYCEATSPQRIVSWLTQLQNYTPEALEPYLYIHSDLDGIHHLLRVASGLDSMLIGEPQILGQIKQAYQQATQLGTIQHQLTPIFQFIFSASKRIRHHSGISNNPISVASTAAQLVRQHYPDLTHARVLLIGTGETSTLVAKYLFQEGISHFIIASRTPEQAEKAFCLSSLPEEIKCSTRNISHSIINVTDIPHYLSHVDIVISATACPIPFINKSWIEQALLNKTPHNEVGESISQHRSLLPAIKKSLLLVDLAVPRDIEPDVQELPGIQLFNIDDLQQLIDQNKTERYRAATQAEQIVEFEIQQYMSHQRRRHAKDIICTYRDKMNKIAQLELKRAQQKLTQGHCQFSVLEEFSSRLVNKLTHIPTIGLQNLADHNPQALSNISNYLLGNMQESVSTFTANSHCDVDSFINFISPELQ